MASPVIVRCPARCYREVEANLVPSGLLPAETQAGGQLSAAWGSNGGQEVAWGYRLSSTEQRSVVERIRIPELRVGRSECTGVTGSRSLGCVDGPLYAECY